MVTLQEAEAMLDEACEALPQEIFKDLNGGVNLIPDVKKGEDGSLILGLYHHNAMGRYVEIFYGSICALYGDIPAEKFRERLKKTLHHELTHHIEGLAWDRSLEHWDEAQQMIGLTPLKAESVLFVDEDDSGLAASAAAFLEKMPADSAGMEQGSGLQSDAVKAAGNLGANIANHVPQQVNETLMARYDVVCCMTMLQADELAERYPEKDEYIICLGETDILPPKLKIGWGSTMKRIKREVAQLYEDICAEMET